MISKYLLGKSNGEYEGVEMFVVVQTKRNYHQLCSARERERERETLRLREEERGEHSRPDL